MPPLFRASWAETPAARPLSQAQVAQPELLLSLHGPGCEELKKSHHDDLAGDPYYLWSGTCTQPWAVSLRHRHWLLDCRGDSTMILRTRQSGDAELRLILGLDDGRWLLSDRSIRASASWVEHAWHFAGVRWQSLDLRGVIGGASVSDPDLARVDAIGFADLMLQPPTGSCVRIEFLEVHAAAVARSLESVPR